jgi:hypothetical protein
MKTPSGATQPPPYTALDPNPRIHVALDDDDMPADIVRALRRHRLGLAVEAAEAPFWKIVATSAKRRKADQR